MKKNIFVILFLAAALSFVSKAGLACSEFLLNNSGKSVMSGRTMDFSIPMNASVVVVPRGEKFASASSPADIYMRWISKYAFVGTDTFHTSAITDGLNEKGLSVAILWLDATKYPDISNVPKEKVVLISDAVRWILGNFATVDEVKRGLKNVVIGGVHFNGMNVIQHLAIHDRNKKSIYVEFVDGKMKIYDNKYNVLTNDPVFPEQVEGLKKYEKLNNSNGGMNGLPGDSSSSGRFARIFILNRFISKAKTDREAVNNANHILNRVTLVNGEVEKCTTQFSVIRDHRNLVYYILDNGNMNLRAIDMKKLDLDPNAKKLTMPIASDNWFIPANDELKVYK